MNVQEALAAVVDGRNLTQQEATETLASIIPALCASGLSILWDDGHCEC